MIARRRDFLLRALALPVAVAVVSVAAFWPAADAEFVNWDDPLTVTRNFDFRGFDRDALQWMWTTSWAGHYQPASWMTLALDYERFGLVASERPDSQGSDSRGPDAGGYHRTNLWLHAAGAVALYFLALELFARIFGVGTAGAGGVVPRLAVAAAFAALAHAIHPLRCESVCWVTERRDVLSGVFFFLALLAWVRGTPSGAARFRGDGLGLGAAAGAAALALFFASVSTDDPASLGWRGPGAPGLALAGVLWLASARYSLGAADGRRLGFRLAGLWLLLASLLSKAWGIVIPAVLLVLDAWPLRRAHLDTGEGRGRAIAQLLLEKVPFAVIALAFARLAYWAQTAQQGSVAMWEHHGLIDRIAQALYGLAFYPVKTLLPVGLVPLHPIPDDLGLLSPRLLAAAFVAIGVTVGLLAMARRHPAPLAAWIAYGVVVSPVLGVQQSGPQFVADRYSYLSCAPFALLAGGALWLASGGSRARRRAAHAVAALLLVVLFGQSFGQSRVWRSSESLWTHAWSTGPRTALAALNLGIVRMDRAVAASDAGERAALLDEAEQLFEQGRALRPGYELFDINQAILLWRRARLADGRVRVDTLDRASQLADRAIATAASRGLEDGAYHFHHGLILLEAGRAPAAVASLERAVTLRPKWPEARLYLATALLAEAERVGLEPGDPERILALNARARTEIEASGNAASISPRASFLRAGAREIDWQILVGLGRDAEAERARAEARRAYASIPSDDPLHGEARLRAARLGAAAPGPGRP